LLPNSADDEFASIGHAQNGQFGWVVDSQFSIYFNLKKSPG
jgi:hypothetical protein